MTDDRPTHAGEHLGRRSRARARLDNDVFAARCMIAYLATQIRAGGNRRLAAQLDRVVDRVAGMTPDERRLSYAWRVLQVPL